MVSAFTEIGQGDRRDLWVGCEELLDASDIILPVGGGGHREGEGNGLGQGPRINGRE